MAKSLQGKIKSDFPKHTLQDALRVAEALQEKNGGRPLPPIEMAEAVGVSPGSSEFRVMLSSSIKYGLTAGSYNSERVSLEDLGRNIVEPRSEHSIRIALAQAATTPPTFNALYEALKGKKLPEQSFFENQLVRDFSVPREHAPKCAQIFLANVEHIGLVKTLPNGKWLSTNVPAAAEGDTETEEPPPNIDAAGPADAALLLPARPARAAVAPLVGKPRVFIAHGKHPQMVAQLKELLTFGNFEPVVAEESETAAKPLPDKVMGHMRTCAAGIIHVASEDELLDKSGSVHHKLNENVLIEIGASMALYGNKFILLVQRGLHLPSNLQGLYCCYYEGEKLDYEATMKLLKAFNEFRAQ